jgi:hypothetical protein
MSFDPRRLRAPDFLSAAAGVALLVLLFGASWYRRGGLDGLDGWHTFSHLRWVLLIAAVLALGSGLLTATQRSPALPVAVDVFMFVVSLITLGWLVYRVLIDQPAGNGLGDVEVGGWVGLAAGVALLAGSWSSLGDESPGRIPDPSDGPSVPTEIRPAPPATAEGHGGPDAAGQGPAPA